MKRLLVTCGLVPALLGGVSASFARTAPAPNDASLQNPIYQPLPNGAGPETNDSEDGVEKVPAASAEEIAKSSVDLNNEELSDLWDAALANSPDIHFIIEKLAPKKESIKSGGTVKDLSHAMYSCVLAGEGMVNSPNQSAGTALIMDVLTDHKNKADKKAATKESDAIMLYKMIRDTARKLTANFYNYKKYMNVLDRANLDLIDLTAMVENTKEKVDSPRRLELEYLLRKQQRDIDSIKQAMERSHKELKVLCGNEAVDKLDIQLAENISLSRRTASRIPRPVFTQPDSSSNN